MEIMSPELISQEFCTLVHQKCNAESTHMLVRHPGAPLLERMLGRQQYHCLHRQSQIRLHRTNPQNFTQPHLHICSSLKISCDQYGLGHHSREQPPHKQLHIVKEFSGPVQNLPDNHQQNMQSHRKGHTGGRDLSNHQQLQGQQH